MSTLISFLINWRFRLWLLLRRCLLGFCYYTHTTYQPVYTVNLVVDDEVANDFRSRGFTVKDMEEGPALLIKRKVNGPNGMVRSAPKLLDQNKQPLSVSCW